MKKYFTIFDTVSAYNADKSTIDLPNVTLIREDYSNIYNPKPMGYQLFDILWSDGTATQNVRPTTDNVTPIGLCVAATGFFGQGEKARFMGLKYMSSKVQKGEGYVWDGSGHANVASLEIGTNNTNVQGLTNFEYIYDTNSSGYLTADWITNTSNKIPSIINGSVYATFDSTVGMSDIDGKSNTTIWDTNDHVDGSAIDYALAYAPTGTNAGDWYVPAIGELACIITYKITINEKLAEIATVYPSDSLSSLYTTNSYWSSTEQDSSNAYMVSIGDGHVGLSGSKTGIYFVLPMCQL